MAFCKVCPCGEIITFETRHSFPEQCPNCNRRVRDFLTYQEDDPKIKILLAQFITDNNTMVDAPVKETAVEATKEKLGITAKAYVLTSVIGGCEIVIPPEGGIIGRGGIGAKQLANNEAVSREHLRVTPRKNAGVIIQDISKYGTKLNGKLIISHTPVRAEVGARITLYDEEFVLQEKEVEFID